MVKRRLDSAVNESLAYREICNPTQLYITYEKSGGLHLVEPGLTAGWHAGRQSS